MNVLNIRPEFDSIIADHLTITSGAAALSDHMIGELLQLHGPRSSCSFDSIDGAINFDDSSPSDARFRLIVKPR